MKLLPYIKNKKKFTTFDIDKDYITAIKATLWKKLMHFHKTYYLVYFIYNTKPTDFFVKPVKLKRIKDYNLIQFTGLASDFFKIINLGYIKASWFSSKNIYIKINYTSQWQNYD